ncbi:MAG TPA: c-type cytochrome [Bryobacteraceae bacterium]|nr:c-type cytochrome [Bryobacteraceae bacterium]
MKRIWIAPVCIALLAGCAQRSAAPGEKPTTFGAAVVLVSGEKQAAGEGAQLEQPVVVQVNNAQGMRVEGALVRFTGAEGMRFQPDRGVTGADGQVTTSVTLGSIAGHYQIEAITPTAAGKPAGIRIDEIAFGYQAALGKQVSDIHCVRCHDSESTPERVSNHDNLDPPPHAFTDGAVLNAMSDANLLAIVGHGGPALGKSPQMPPYGNTLTAAEMDALVAYVRAIADPPYRTQGVFYAGN